MESQNQRLLAHLERHGKINPMEALTKLGIYRLAARAGELKAKGYSIESKRVTVPNRFGEACVVAEYSMKKGGAV